MRESADEEVDEAGAITDLEARLADAEAEERTLCGLLRQKEKSLRSVGKELLTREKDLLVAQRRKSAVCAKVRNEVSCFAVPFYRRPSIKMTASSRLVLQESLERGGPI